MWHFEKSNGEFHDLLYVLHFYLFFLVSHTDKKMSSFKPTKLNGNVHTEDANGTHDNVENTRRDSYGSYQEATQVTYNPAYSKVKSHKEKKRKKDR